VTRDSQILLYADGAVLAEMVAAREKGLVKGFTTNPTLMRKAGITDYAAFAREALAAIPDLPICFEVFADAFPEMEQQARLIASWGDNVFVKIPITNTRGESALALVSLLAEAGVKVNVTAILTLEQVEGAARVLRADVPSIVSVFAGRIADTGRDPQPVVRKAVERLKPLPQSRLLWASTRELLNLFQAEACGCHIITVPPEILKKLDLKNMPLDALSLDTVRMFHRDALSAGFSL